ncbi:MAG: hypothetical protein P8M34_11980 [Saprospiraceae bacterium]|nr:hypothetical protein [Saprospiraceae bacterium]
MRHTVIFICALLCFTTDQLSAQKGTKVDVVKLTDGSVLVGQFLNVTDTSYLFSTASMDSIHINKKFISSIDFGITEVDNTIYENRKVKTIKKEKVYKNTGIFGMTDVGMVSGEEVHWHASLTLGYRLNPRFYLGIQGGKENILNAQPLLWQTDGIWPIGIYGRYYPLKTKLRPYVSTRVGYAFIDDKFNTMKSGGMNILPGIGIHFPSRNGLHFHISLHQYFQKTQGTSEMDIGMQNPIVINYDLWYNRSVVKIGVEF